MSYVVKEKFEIAVETNAVEYCLTHPRWRLSLQTHKYLGIA